MRILENEFIQDLKNGVLSDFLQAVKADDTLCLEIRENKINIYYRGGNMFTICRYKNRYKVSFDLGYCNNKKFSKYKNILQQLKDDEYKQWVDNIPFIKYEMDTWFREHPKLEREYQQLIVRENNNSKIANDTDYYICDIEYADSQNKSRFDILGIKWLSKAQDRKKADNVGIVFIEMKYGDDAINGECGIKKHIEDINEFLHDKVKTQLIYKEIENMFNQKVELGLILGVEKRISINREIAPEFILLFANHKPVKSAIETELNNVIRSKEYSDLKRKANVRIARASCMGYGLYNDHMISFEDFINKWLILEKI